MNFAFDTLHFHLNGGGPSSVTLHLMSSLVDHGHSVSTVGPTHPEPSVPRMLLAALKPARVADTGQIVIANEIRPRNIPGRLQVALVHDLFALDRPEWTRGIERYFQTRRFRWIIAHAGLIVVPSPEVYERFTFHFPGLQGRTETVAWGAAGTFLDARRKIPGRTRAIIATGDSTPRKETGALQRWYRSRSRDYPLWFTGDLPLESLAERVAGAACYLSFSRDEGFGLAIAEALAAGTPVVARRFPGGATRFRKGVLWFDSETEVDALVGTALSGEVPLPAPAEIRTWGHVAADFEAAVLRHLPT